MRVVSTGTSRTPTINFCRKSGILLLLITLTVTVRGQTITTPSPLYNHFLHEDSQGFFWVGTLEGWYRTDGTRFESFGVEEDNAEGYDRYVQSDLYPDGRGGLWYAGYKGLHRIDETTNDLRSFRLTVSRDSVPEGYRLFHLDGARGELWLRISDRLYTFSLDDERFTEVGAKSDAYEFAVRSGEDGRPDLVIGCRWYAGPGFEIYRRPNSPEEQWSKLTMTLPDRLAGHVFSSAVFVGPNLVVLGTSGGLATYNPRTEDLRLLSPLLGYDLPAGDIIDVLLTADGQLYATERGKGVWTFPVENGEVSWALARKTQTLENPGMLDQDGSGNVWATEQAGGIRRVMPRQKQLFSQHQEQPLKDLRIGPDNTPYGLTARGEVIPLLQPERRFQLSGQASGDYRQLKFSWKDWFGLHDYGVQRRTGGREFPVGHTGVLTVHESGEALVAGAGGLLRVPFEADRPLRRPNWKQEVDGWAVDFLQYRPGRELVMAYKTSELWYCRWDPDSLQLAQRLPLAADVKSFAYGNDGRTDWVGTADGLFAVHDKERIERVILDDREPLRPDVSVIVPVGDSLLVLGTSRGLLLHHLGSGRTRRYTQADGLPGHNFRAGAGGVDANGDCWLLVDKQALSFCSGDLLAPSSSAPQPYVAQLWINDMPEAASARQLGAGGLELPYYENDLRFSVRNLGFVAPELTSVAIRLIGRDTVWKDIPQGFPVAYSNLPPGTYRLEVQSKDKNGNYTTPRSFPVRIVPPWHDNVFVRTLLMVSLVLLGFLINQFFARRANQRLRRHQERQQAISDERMRIARRLHDDLGSDLTSIMSVLSTYRYLEERSGKTQQLDITELQDLVQDASANMREIVWAIDDQKCQFHHLMEQMTNLVKSRSREQWEAVIEFPPNPPNYQFSAEQKLNIYLILKEGLQNITRHAPGTTVVSLKVRFTDGQPGYFELQLSDNGPGLGQDGDGEAAAEISGFGLDNMRHRAATIGARFSLENTLPHGTALTLALPVVALAEPPLQD